MSKATKLCTHPNTLQVGTETTVEVWCTDCNEIIKVGKVIKKKKI
jgi:hypothetical protein